MASTHTAYLKMKMPAPRGPLTVVGNYKVSMETASAGSNLAESLVIAEEKKRMQTAVALAQSSKLSLAAMSGSLDSPTFKPTNETKNIVLDPAYPERTVRIGVPRELAEHSLNVRKDAKPVRQPLRRFAEDRRKIIGEEVTKLLVAGFIVEVTHTEWLANPVLVEKKKDENLEAKLAKVWRMCIDYTNLNKACPRDPFPLPRIDQVIDSTAGYLVVQQCSGDWDAKDANMALYRFHVQKIAGFFEGCEFHHVPRAENEAADTLSKLGSSRQEIPPGIALAHLRVPSIKPSPESESIFVPESHVVPMEIDEGNPGTTPANSGTVPANSGTATPMPEEAMLVDSMDIDMPVFVVRETPSWVEPIKEFLINGTLPVDENESRRIQRRSKAYTIINGEVYKRSVTGVLQRCVEPEEGKEMLEEIHRGECGHHASSRALVAKVFRHGFYWPTALDNAEDLKRSYQPTFSMTHQGCSSIPKKRKEARENDVDLLEEARELALARTAIYQQNLRRYHSRKVNPRVFREGDLVLRLVQRTEGRHKLSPPWEGPFIVSKALHNDAYYLIDAQEWKKGKADRSGEETKRPWNVALLRPFYS
ncbi:hypothetical protein QYE76_012410 [Lolium multiflorum]|uniref:RNase H type-1 domain-containing protein n=1 Tax=Lolium multiflorum TaxID=4521 RepID=A0AAD8U0Z8_LOLMU|nr:hypothetical protein QYE76_012410 [Lolium multiflorum]